MASPTQWTWVWANSRSWWWTGKPGMLQSMGSQRVGHDWATELNWTEHCRWMDSLVQGVGINACWSMAWENPPQILSVCYCYQCPLLSCSRSSWQAPREEGMEVTIAEITGPVLAEPGAAATSCNPYQPFLPHHLQWLCPKWLPHCGHHSTAIEAAACETNLICLCFM